MGLDALSIVQEIEKSFGVDLSQPEVARMYGTDRPRGEQVETTAGFIHENLCNFLKERGLDIPEDSWERVRFCIAEGIRCWPFNRTKPEDVKRESRLHQDLGAT